MTVPLAAQAAQQQPQNRWADPKCDLKPNHFQVNQGMMYLKSATTGKFEDQKKKDLADAQRVLTEALTSGGQHENPAAWYYLGRYYLITGDAQGADSALTRAETLKPACKDDVGFWRRYVWQFSFNAGIEASRVNNTDSAIASFRRATFLLPLEPTSYKYLAILFYNAGKGDSATAYFRRTADVSAKDPKYAQERKEALNNLGRIQHSLQMLPEAIATYREYLGLYPGDPEIMAGLGGAYLQLSGKDTTFAAYKDSALAIYRQLIAKGDSIGYYQLYLVGAQISQSVPEDPDTSVIGENCRKQAGTIRPRLTLVRIRARCDSVTTRVAKDYFSSSREAFTLAARALDTSLKINPYYRETLIFRANTALGMRDSTTALAMSRRLLAIDPMNRTGIKIMASSQGQNGKVDSALFYFRLSDSLLVGDVAVPTFDSTDTGREVRVIVTNPREKPNAPYKLVFEFVDLQGQVVATDTVAVPPIQPGQSQQFELKPAGASIAAWRYRKEGA
ncbi:MAG TPA: tetratricopeptide repeat protein [Gemmatimonadales bacterium]|nr:tetratricopeptide repeat protein [Gemmatimonadales bacterium]